jgi:predicted transcriptional regulator
MLDFNMIGWIISSKYRKLILEALSVNSKTITELYEEYDVKRSSLYVCTRDLKNRGLIFKDGKKWVITAKGLETINNVHCLRKE